VLWRDVEYPHVVDGLDRVAGTDGLHEVISGVQEQHWYARANLRGQIDQHGVLHIGGHHVVAGRRGPGPADAAEVLVSPTQQVAGTGAFQLCSALLGQLS
jgi:hypothetical protein